jgi:fatty acid-binding protein DegV
LDNVKILADSTCDLPGVLIDRLDIGIVPLYVLLGERTYRDAWISTKNDIRPF